MPDTLAGQDRVPGPVAHPLERWLDRTTQALNVVGTALIVGLMALIGADVAARNLFNAPIAGVPEMVTLAIVAIVFLQVPQALRAGRFTRSDALLGAIRRARPRVANAMEIVFDLAAIGLLSALVYAVWPLFLRDWQRGTFMGAVGDFTVPLWPVKLVICIGTAMLIAQFTARIVRNLQGRAP